MVEYARPLIERTLSGDYENDRVGKVGTYAFSFTNNLTSVCMPNVVDVGSYAFAESQKLSIADLGATKSVGSRAFYLCLAFKTLILRGETVCTLANVDALTRTLIASGTGYIYVPRALLSDTDETKDYRRATNWSTFASQFRALEGYTVDGTIYGELDETKIAA